MEDNKDNIASRTYPGSYVYREPDNHGEVSIHGDAYEDSSVHGIAWGDASDHTISVGQGGTEKIKVGGDYYDYHPPYVCKNSLCKIKKFCRHYENTNPWNAWDYHNKKDYYQDTIHQYTFYSSSFRDCIASSKDVSLSQKKKENMMSEEERQEILDKVRESIGCSEFEFNYDYLLSEDFKKSGTEEKKKVVSILDKHPDLYRIMIDDEKRKVHEHEQQ